MAQRKLPKALADRANTEVFERFRRLLPGMSGYFLDGLDMLEEEPPRRTVAHLVAHVAREIESGLRDVVRGLVGRRPKRTGEEDGHLKDVEALLADLGLSKHPDAESWRAFASKESWHKVAHRNDLGAPRAQQLAAERWQRFVTMLRAVLDAVDAKFLEVVRTVEHYAAIEAPSKKQIKELKDCLPLESIAADRFLKKATAGWLRPLAESGFFDAPPEAEPIEDGFRLPVWSQSLYLVRVAATDSEGVAKVIAAIPATESMLTHCHYLQAAAAMPGHYASAVANREVAWLRSHPNTIDWVVLSAEPLARQLVSEGEVNAALAMLDALLERRPPEASGGRRFHQGLQISQYHMRALASGPLRDLAARAPTPTLSMLCGALERAQEGESSLWRTAIEPDGQNVDFDALSTLVDLTRDVACGVARRPGLLTKVVEDLEARKASIFQRLAIHVLRTVSTTRSQELLDRLASPDLSASSEWFHEVAAALFERFGEFTREQQAEIRQAMRKDAERAGASAGADDVQVRDARQSTWFQIIERWLPEDERPEFDALVARTGRWPYPGYRSWHSSGRLHPTRFTYEQVASITDQELIALVREHQHDEMPEISFEDDVGLERALGVMITENPERLTRLAREFSGLPPRFIVMALSAAVGVFQNRRDGSLDEAAVEGVVTLCEATVTERALREEGKTWAAAQREAATVVLDIADRMKRMSPGLIPRAVEVVQALARSADPTPEREPSEAERTRESITFAGSSVRGSARFAAIALLSDDSEPDTVEARAANARLRPIIDAALDAQGEPSPTLRASIARHFWRIFAVDAQWAAGVASQLFDEIGSVEGTPEAWRTYLEWHRACLPLYPLLAPYYAVSAERVSGYDEHSACALGQHLADLVAFGAIDPRVEGSPIAEFVANASPQAKLHVLDSIGRKLRGSEPIDPDILERIQSLWTWWRERAEVIHRVDELRAFGIWFGSSRFDRAWALAELERVLVLTGGHLQWDDELLDLLAECAAFSREGVARCMKMLIDTSDSWLFIGREGIRGVVAALATTEGGQRLADEIRSRLLAHGFGDVEGT